ncbi:MAG: hypothetical protein AB4041_18995 [Microcystaceae cyanobacterium]
MTKYKWLVEIYLGKVKRMEAISSSLLSCKQLNIVFRIDGEILRAFLTCADFNDLASQDEVKEMAIQKLLLFNGIAYLLKIENHPFSFMFFPTIELDNYPDYKCYTGKEEISDPFFKTQLEKMNYLLDKLTEDEQYHKIIRFLGEHYTRNRLDWFNLYKIYEIARAKYLLLDEETNKFLSKDKKWVNFRRTANHPETGDNARHGYSTEKPTDSPIPLEEARELIRVVCLQLTEKLFSLNLQEYQ